MRRLTLLLSLSILILLCFSETRAEAPDRESGRFFPSSAFRPRLTFSRTDCIGQDLKDQEAVDGEKSGNKRLGLAVLEFFGVMAYSQTKYWITYGDWLEDWHYQLSWEDQKKRLFGFEAWKFDSNNFNLNWSHALAGALYYEIARTNNLNVLESFLFTTAGSMYWEYIVEWRNVVSINDNIFSAVGGISIGEAWFQLGRYFRGRKGTLNAVLGFINPLQKINDWLNGGVTKTGPEDAEPLSHDFCFFLGGRNALLPEAADRSNHALSGVRTRIYGLPDYAQPGEAVEAVREVFLTDVEFDLTLGNRGIEEANLFTRVVFLGGLKKKIDERHHGYQVFLGLGSAFSYFRERSVAYYDSNKVKVRRGYDLRLGEPRNFRDKLAVVHIAGPFFELRTFSSRLKLGLILDAYLDFAQVNAFALNEYSKDHDISGIKTPLLYYGYYNAAGTSLFSELTVEYGRMRLEGHLKYHYFNSIEGWDRFQSELTDDFDIRDSRARYGMNLYVPLGRTPLELWLALEGVDRRGKIERVDRKSHGARYFFGLNYRF